MSNSCKVTCVGSSSDVPEGCGVSPVDDAVVAYVVLAGMVDPDGEIKRLTKKVKDCEAQKAKLVKKMEMPLYEKTPEQYKEEDQAKLAKFDSEMANLLEAVEGFKKMKEGAGKRKKEDEEVASAAAAPPPPQDKEEESTGGLEGGEAITKKGIVKKSSTGIFSFIGGSQTRTLVLTSKPRLYYMDGIEVKGEFTFLKACTKKSDTSFLLKTIEKERIIETEESDAWIKAITDAFKLK